MMEVIAVCLNAAVPMVKSPLFSISANVTDARLEHSANALELISVTDAGMMMEVSAVFLNAAIPIDVTDAGISMEVIARSWNTACPMVRSPLPAANVTDVRLVP